MQSLALRKIAEIARTEFRVTVLRKGYLLAVLGLPALMALAAFASVMAGRAQGGVGRAAIVDQAHILELGWAQELAERMHDSSSSLDAVREGGDVQFGAYDNVERAISDLRSGSLRAVYVLPPDYRNSRQIDVYTRSQGLVIELARPGERKLASIIRASLMGTRADVPSIARMIEPLRIRESRVSPEGTIRPIRNEYEKLAGFVLSFGVFLLFGLSIFLSSNYLLQSTAEEKENRVIEAILSSVRPLELLVGKLAGLGAAGLLQVSVYMAVFFVPAILLVSGVEMTIARLLLSFLFFILGFLLFASLMAVIGMLSNSVREGTQMATLWTTIAVLPMMLFQPISQAPQAGWVVALSWFPLTAPLTMLVRLSVSTPRAVDVAASVAVMIGAIVFVIWSGAKIFRIALLLSGKRLTGAQVWRWMREA